MALDPRLLSDKKLVEEIQAAYRDLRVTSGEERQSLAYVHRAGDGRSATVYRPSVREVRAQGVLRSVRQNRPGRGSAQEGGLVRLR